MRVELDGGEIIDLGTTEVTPTISIVDYSRRETDSFGVTTVVERGFARRLSVRLGVPFDDVDALQQRLAALRATAANWVADDSLASLSFRGFYKDFDLDLNVPPLSFCTLTVEGLALSEALADSGADPAPPDSASTFQLLQPATIAGAALAASNVPEDDYPQWAAGTSYALGTRVVRTGTHRVWESAAANNAGHDPASASGMWIDIGPTNRWAMFDHALGTATTAAGSLVVTLAAGTVDAVALLDVVADTIRVEAAGYDRTVPAGAGTTTFLDLPTVATPVTVTIAGSGTVSVGTLLVGLLVGLGVTEASPTAGIIDYSRKDVDDFGEVAIVQRAWAKRMTAKALIATDAIDDVVARLVAVRARPSLWIGQAWLDSLTIYGFFKSFEIQRDEHVSKLSLSIEGLSAAAKVAPLTVAWPDITDPNGTRPVDNATNSRDPASPFGPAGTVGDAVALLESADESITAAQALLADLRADADGLLEQASALQQEGQELRGLVTGLQADADTLRSDNDVAVLAALQSALVSEASRLRAEASALLGGQKVSLVLRQEILSRQEGDTTILERIDLLGVVSEDGSAFVLDLSKVLVSPTQTFAGRLAQLTAELQGDIDTKASVTQLGEAVAGEADARATALQQVVAELDGQIDTKASVTSLQQAIVDQQEALVLASQTIQADYDGKLGSKASITYVDQARADAISAAATSISETKAELQGDIGAKASISYVDQAKVDAISASASSLAQTTAELQGALGGKASVTYVDEAKADAIGAAAGSLAETKAELQGAIGGKASISYVDQAKVDAVSASATSLAETKAELQGNISGKASITYVDQAKADAIGASAQSLQQTAAQLESDIGGKASITYVNDAKADAVSAAAGSLAETKAELQGDIGGKASTTYVDQAKADAIGASAQSLQQTAAQLESDIGGKASITYVNDAKADAVSAAAGSLAETKAELQGDIGGKASTTYVDQAKADAIGASAQSLGQTKAELEGELAGKASTEALSQAIVDQDQARASALATVNASIGTVDGRITDLREVVVDATGAVAAKAILQLDANGHVVGFVATNNGATGAIVFTFDSTTFLLPDGSPLIVADQNGVYMPSVTVERLKVNTAVTPQALTLSAPVVGTGFPSSGTGSGGAIGGGGGGFTPNEPAEG